MALNGASKMRRGIFILLTLFLGILYSNVNTNVLVASSQEKEFNVNDTQKEQSTIIREHLVGGLSYTIQTGNNIISRIPTRTLHHLMSHRYMLEKVNLTKRSEYNVVFFKFLTTLKVSPYSKYYYVFFLNKLTC